MFSLVARWNGVASFLAEMCATSHPMRTFHWSACIGRQAVSFGLDRSAPNVHPSIMMVSIESWPHLFRWRTQLEGAIDRVKPTAIDLRDGSRSWRHRAMRSRGASVLRAACSLCDECDDMSRRQTG